MRVLSSFVLSFLFFFNSNASFVGTYFDYRNVNITQGECEICDSLNLPSYPNVGFFLSEEPSWNFLLRRDEKEKKDLIASYVSSFGFPSNLHCYFHKDAQYDLEINWEGFLNGESGSVKIGSGYFCIGFVLEDIVEYEDMDGDNVYNPKVDKDVFVYNIFKSKWKKAETLSKNYLSLKAQTKDEIVTIKWSASPMIIKIPELSHILTPNGTVMQIEIRNFPFDRTKKTKLAIRGYVAVDGDGDREFSHPPQKMPFVKIGNELNHGYFGWSDKVVASFASLTGKPIVIGPRSESYDDGTFNLVKAILGTTAKIQNIYFSFPDEDQPELLKWDSACGYGEAPEVDRVADIIVACVLFTMLLVPAIIITALFRRWIKRVQDSEERRPLAASISSRQSTP